MEDEKTIKLFFARSEEAIRQTDIDDSCTPYCCKNHPEEASASVSPPNPYKHNSHPPGGCCYTVLCAPGFSGAPQVPWESPKQDCCTAVGGLPGRFRHLIME